MLAVEAESRKALKPELSGFGGQTHSEELSTRVKDMLLAQPLNPLCDLGFSVQPRWEQVPEGLLV